MRPIDSTVTTYSICSAPPLVLQILIDVRLGLNDPPALGRQDFVYRSAPSARSKSLFNPTSKSLNLSRLQPVDCSIPAYIFPGHLLIAAEPLQKKESIDKNLFIFLVLPIYLAYTPPTFE